MILQRDYFTCRYCGIGAPEVRLQVDHVVSVKDGGSAHPDNLVTSCLPCNSGKSAFSASPPRELLPTFRTVHSEEDLAEALAEMHAKHDPIERRYELLKALWKLFPGERIGLPRIMPLLIRSIAGVVQ